MIKNFFKKFDNFVFDLGGTIWKWDYLIDGVRETLQILRNFNKRIIFFTDNTLLTREGYVNKLRKFGISVEKDEVITSSMAAVKLFENKKVFTVGEGLITELRKGNVKVVTTEVDHVVLGLDRNLSYEKLSLMIDLVNKGAKFYKMSKSNLFLNGNKVLPDVGAISKVVELVTGKKAVLIGSPSKYMVEVFKGLNLDPEKTVLIGDECDSDIALGNTLGYTTVLVTTGIDTEMDYLKARGINEPNLIINSVKDILGK